MSETRKLATLIADVVQTSPSDREESKPSVDDGRQTYFALAIEWRLMARTPVLAEATPVGALSALSGNLRPGLRRAESS